MTVQPKSVIKTYFQTGDKPEQGQYEDLIDSYADVSAVIPTSAAGVVGLQILGATTSASAQSAMGLGTMATQNANNISVSGGTMRGVSTSGGTSRNQVITSATINGGTINGTPMVFTSFANPAVALGTTNQFFPISGIGTNPLSGSNTGQNGGVMPVGGVVRGFTTYLNDVASGGTRTFSVYKNGATSGLSISYGSAENLAKNVTGSANFVVGDYLEILSSTQGAGVNNSGGKFAVFCTINNS